MKLAISPSQTKIVGDIMPFPKKKITFDTSEVTTGGTTKPSNAFNSKDWENMVVYVKNTANDAVTVTGVGSPLEDFSESWDMDNPLSLSDGSGTATYDYTVVGDAHHYMKIRVSADNSDATSGQVDVWIASRDE